MNRQPPSLETSVALPHVWSGLPSDLQLRTVRLLAQLAFARLRQYAPFHTQEINYDHATQQPQDPPRPS
jgi:hypothetical protein